jgi:hypothetical protein
MLVPAHRRGEHRGAGRRLPGLNEARDGAQLLVKRLPLGLRRGEVRPVLRIAHVARVVLGEALLDDRLVTLQHRRKGGENLWIAVQDVARVLQAVVREGPLHVVDEPGRRHVALRDLVRVGVQAVERVDGVAHRADHDRDDRGEAGEKLCTDVQAHR